MTRSTDIGEMDLRGEHLGRQHVATPRGWTNCRKPRRLSIIAVGFLAWTACCFSVTVAADEKSVTKPDSAQKLFASLGVNESQWSRLHDAVPISEAETDVLLRMLYRLRMFPPADVERWAHDANDLAAVVRDPAASRGQIYRLRGEVLAVEAAQPDADMAQRYELSKYYRCRLKLEGPDWRMAEIFVQDVPAAWQNGVDSGPRGGTLAAFAKTSKDASGGPELVFVAPRLAWYPDTPLGNLGMDVGLLGSLQDQKLVLGNESEAFYQMLAAVGRAQPGQLLREADQQLSTLPADRRWKDSQGIEQYSVVPLFNDPASQRGRLVALSGTVRRIERVAVDDPQMQQLAGLTHYYQVALFTDDSSGNPLTFCLRELPPGMTANTSSGYAERVRIAGFFFKTWSYRVQKLADPTLSPGDPKTHRLLSPLLIGRSLEWFAAPPPADTTSWNIIVAVVFFAIMLAIWGLAWRSRRRERQLVDDLTAARPDVDVAADLATSGDAPGRPLPDFDTIARMDQRPAPGEHQE